MLIEITWSNTKRKMPEDKSPSPSSRQPIPIRWRVLSQGWRSGNSARLPPMWPGFDSDPVPYVGWVCCWFSTSLKGFSPGCPVPPPPPQKPTLQIGHLHNPFTWYGINYAGTQITQWDFQNKRTRTIPARLHFVLKVPLFNLRPCIIYSVPRDRIVQRAYSNSIPHENQLRLMWLPL